MIPRVEHIGQVVSWPRRIRSIWRDLFGSRMLLLLEHDLLRMRMERDALQRELKATQERLLEVMAATKGIPWRPLQLSEKPEAKAAVKVPATRWQQVQAEAIAENARLEAEDAEKSKSAAQEN